MNKNSIRSLTTGALFCAIYGVFLLLIRYVFTSSDSIIYYFLPLPIAIFLYWKESKYGILVLIVSSLLSFLLVDPYHALMLFIPHILIGFTFGILKKHISNLWTIIFTFLVALAADYLSIYAFELITGISYFSSSVEEMSFLPINPELLNIVVTIAIPVTLVLDSLIKVVLSSILFILLVRRLGIDREISLNYRLRFQPFLSIISLGLLVLTFIFVRFGFINFNTMWKLLIIIIFSLCLILGFYLIFIVFSYFGILLRYKGKSGLAVLVTILGILLFPITYFIALFINLFYKQIF